MQASTEKRFDRQVCPPSRHRKQHLRLSAMKLQPLGVGWKEGHPDREGVLGKAHGTGNTTA